MEILISLLNSSRSSLITLIPNTQKQGSMLLSAPKPKLKTIDGKLVERPLPDNNPRMNLPEENFELPLSRRIVKKHKANAGKCPVRVFSKALFSDIYIRKDFESPGFRISIKKKDSDDFEAPLKEYLFPFKAFGRFGKETYFLQAYTSKEDLSTLVELGREVIKGNLKNTFEAIFPTDPDLFENFEQVTIKRKYMTAKRRAELELAAIKNRGLTRAEERRNYKADRNRRILELIATTQQSYKEIGQKLSVSASTVSRAFGLWRKDPHKSITNLPMPTVKELLAKHSDYLQAKYAEKGYLGKDWEELVSDIQIQEVGLRNRKPKTIQTCLSQLYSIRSLSVRHTTARMNRETYLLCIRGFAKKLLDLYSAGALVYYIDESCIMDGNFKKRAISFRGMRPQTAAPSNLYNINILACVGMSGVLAVQASEKRFNRDAFFRFFDLITQFEEVGGVPKKTEVWFVLDNAQIHTGAAIRQLAKSRGISFLFIPPKFPEGNCAEALFATVKAPLRKLFKAKRGAILGILSAGFNKFNRQHVIAYLRHLITSIDPTVLNIP